LFREGLRSLGYKITSLQGRVVRGMAIDAPRRGHLHHQTATAEHDAEEWQSRCRRYC
jgi:arylamine N-acetyltransferase